MIILIAARSRNNVIGKNGKIPWNINGEQKQFETLTVGKTVILGRCSYEEIGHPLPGRNTIVVSRTKKFEGDNLHTADSVKNAIKKAHGEDICIAGGYALYKETIPLADIIYITEVDVEIENGDVFFPAFDADKFDLIIGETAGENIKYTRTMYIRKNKN